MNLKFLAPIMAIAVSFVILLVAGFTLPASASEANTNYFIKPIQADRILLVEPNLLGFVRSGMEPANAGELLLEALDEIEQRYTVASTKLVHVLRNNGKRVPNLFVYVEPGNAVQASVAEAVSDL